MFDSEVAEELFGSSGAKFFALICDEIDRGAKAAYSMIEDCRGYSGSIFVW